MGQSAGLQMTQSWAEWPINQRVVLPSRGTSTGWRNGLTQTSWTLIQGAAKSCPWGGTTPGASIYSIQGAAQCSALVTPHLECSVSSSGLPSTRDTWESPVKGHEDEEGTGAPLLWEEAEGAGDCSAWRRDGSEDLVNVCEYLRGGYKGDGARLFSGAQWQDQRPWAHTETREVPSEHQETLFYCEGDQTLAQVAQGGCGDSILRDIQKTFGHGPGQLSPGGLAWGLDQMTSRGTFQPQPSCDSVTVCILNRCRRLTRQPAAKHQTAARSPQRDGEEKRTKGETRGLR